jgi:hypothetical protein
MSVIVTVGSNMTVALAQFGRVSAALRASRHDDVYEAAERSASMKPTLVTPSGARASPLLLSREAGAGGVYGPVPRRSLAWRDAASFVVRFMLHG